MRYVPIDIIRTLEAVGIVRPWKYRWVRHVPDCRHGFQHIVHHCNCKKQMWRVKMWPIELKGRPIYCGQCPARDCKTIYWCERIIEPEPPEQERRMRIAV